MRSIIFLATTVLIFVALAVPFSAQAVWVPGQPIVPCDGSAAKPCDFNALVVLANNIISIGIYLAILVAVAMFAFAGWLYLTSAGDVGKMKHAHTVATNAVFGFVFVLTAWLIITLVLGALVCKPGEKDSAGNEKPCTVRPLLEKIFGTL